MLELLTRHTVLCADETSSICQTLPLLVLWGNTVRSIHIHLNDPQDYTKNVVRALRRITVHRSFVLNYEIPVKPLKILEASM